MRRLSLSCGRRTFALCLAGFALLGSAGCRPAEEWNIVRSRSGLEFQQWRAAAIHQMTPAERDELDALVDELRWSETPPLTKEAVYALIDRKPLADVLRLGYEARIRRLDPLWGELKGAVDSNALLMTKPGDSAAALALQRYQREQHARLEKLGAQLHEAEKRFAELTGRPAATRPREIAPLALRRTEGLREIDSLIERRRAEGRASFGDWPIQFDADGSRLAGAQRDEFDRRQARAKTEGRAIVAVHVRDRWWIYDAPKEDPSFPPAVMAHLTDPDRRTLDGQWLALQAELWAREQSHHESRENPTAPTPRRIEISPPKRL